jgi:leader peptidase (prepilin peptidase)/N-methyltransferase
LPVRSASVAVGLLTPSLAGVLVGAAVADVRTGVVPNRLVLPSLAVFVVTVASLNLLGLGANIVDGLIGLAIFGGSLAGLSLWKPKGMGMGDAKLAALIGLVLGSLGLRYAEFAAVVAFLLGSIWAVALLAFTRRGGQSKLAFAPLLAAGGLVACVLAWMR